MASRGVKAWAWWCIVALAAFAWSWYFLNTLVADWFPLAGVAIVFFCLFRLYRALGDDTLLPEAARKLLRRHVLMFGPAGALETLMVCYGFQKTPAG